MRKNKWLIHRRVNPWLFLFVFHPSDEGLEKSLSYYFFILIFFFLFTDTRMRYMDTEGSMHDGMIGNNNWMLGDLRSLHRCVPTFRRPGKIRSMKENLI